MMFTSPVCRLVGAPGFASGCGASRRAPPPPQRGPATEVVPSPVAFSREGPFDVSSEPAAAGDHPLILMGLPYPG